MKMTLNEIFTCKEINGKEVTRIGTKNLVATFKDVEGNIIAVDVDCDDCPEIKDREKLSHLTGRGTW